MTRFKQAEDGETIYPVHEGYKLCCCDCGLVHQIDFHIVRKTHIQPDGSYIPVAIKGHKDLQITFEATRDARSTALKRRWKRLNGWKGIK